jgi:hypothetical protein
MIKMITETQERCRDSIANCAVNSSVKLHEIDVVVWGEDTCEASCL